jgi:putative heme iron utilization protein
MKGALLAITFLAAYVAITHAGTTPTPTSGDAAHTQACSQLKTLNAKEKADVQALEAQIKTLRQQLDGQLKPLEEQRKTLVEQYRAQRDSLMDQIVPGSGAARQGFETQMKTLNDQEQADIKAIRDKSAATRHGMTPPKADLHCK